MVRDIFISYVNEDKSAADTICTNLESYGLQCWIAPRNIAQGEKYAPAIIHAIDNAKIVVVVFSHSSDQSEHIRTEIERAFNHAKMIIPFRIENIEPSDEVQYFIGSRQWLDAFSGSLDEHTNRLADIIKKHLTTDSEYQGSQEQPTASKFDQYRVNNNIISQQNNKNVKISPLLRRVIAYSVDLGLGLLFSFLFFLVIYIGLSIVLGADGFNNLMKLDDKITNSVVGSLITGSLLSTGMILFLAFFDISASYRSPGKKLMALKIFKYPPLSKSRIWRIIRSLTKNMPLIVMLLGYIIAVSIPNNSLGSLVFFIGLILQIIWGILLFVTPKSQSVHDLVAGTTVISDKK